VVYKPGTNEIDYERLFKYFQAEIPQKETQKFYELEKNDKKNIEDDK
jgi:hypothetical protein